ncbi:SRPBCC family protein [Streptomyces sp. NPDC090306]|uniref:SRPBCC family protein n=1 Tax=unclassified Streptomyces TaxID=2593676 RepID=UPI0036E4703B
MTDVAPGGPRITGTLRDEGGRGVVRVEDVYDTDAADLWQALTRPQRLERWLARVEGDLEVGGEFHILFTSGWEGPGRVDVCDEPHRLAVTTGRGSDETVVEAVLTPEGTKTRLVIEERGVGLGELAAHGAGWQVHTEDLAAHLAGREPSDWLTGQQALAPAYRAMEVARVEG